MTCRRTRHSPLHPEHGGHRRSTYRPHGTQFITEHGRDPAGRVVWTKSPLGDRVATVYDNAGLPLFELNENGNPIIDSFNRPNSAPGSFSLGNAETGDLWSSFAGGNVAVEGSQAKLTSGTGVQAAVLTANANGGFGIVLGDNPNGAGMIFRAADPSNYWKLVAVSASNRFELTKIVGGVTTATYNSPAGTCCTPGQQVIMGMFGKVLVGFADGAGIFLIDEGIDTTLQTNSKVGVLLGTTSAGKVDAFFASAATSFVDGPEINANAFDDAGNQTRSSDGAFRNTRYNYNFNDELTDVTRSDTSILRYEYDDNGMRTSYKDATTAETSWTYDNQDRVKTMTRPGKSAETYAYNYKDLSDPNDLEQRVTTRPGGGTMTTTMDQVGRPQTIDYSGSTTADVFLTYDPVDRLTKMDTGTSESSWTYDALGRLKASSRAGRVIAYGYTDLSPNVTSITYPTNHTVNQFYDDDSRMTSMTDWNGNPVSFEYDADSNFTKTNYPGSVTATRTYNPAGFLRNIEHKKGATSLGTYGYTRAKENRLGSTATDGGAAELHGYGNANSLPRLVSSGANTWAYDAADNPTIRNTEQQKFNTSGSGEICWRGVRLS